MPSINLGEDELWVLLVNLAELTLVCAFTAFGVPAKEFKAEMDKLDLDSPDSEDARERIEDLDEDPDQESLKD